MRAFALLLILLASPLQAATDNEGLSDLVGEPAAAEPKPTKMGLDEQLDAVDRRANKRKQVDEPATILPPATNVVPDAENRPAAPPAYAYPVNPSWYRDLSEWVASRTIRDGLVGDEPTSKILTDGHRYDVSIGKRIPILVFGEATLTRGWSAGFDGGMLATLFRSKNRSSNVTFSSENFDGFFGAYLARALDDTIIMYRIGHISSHLVDNNPQILRSIPYSRFWQEIIVSQTLNSILKASNWDLHIQGSLGLNFMSEPAKSNPRALLGVDVGRNLGESGSVAMISSLDFRHPGVAQQKPNFSAFLGIGRLKRPQTTGRPYKVGVSHHWGSDYRNQYYLRRTHFTSFEVQLEF